MRTLLEIDADIQRYESAVDAAIGLVTSRSIRPSRGWSMACKNLQDRLAAAREEYDAALPQQGEG